jgi:hypothetical protein
MRLLESLLFFVLVVSVQGQDQIPEQSTIQFSYQELPSEPGSTDFAVKGDTVRFDLYYIDVQCEGYVYRFRQEGSSLIVHRVSNDTSRCSNEEQYLYAMKGSLTGVPRGKYLFELRTGAVESATRELFREVIVVK